MGHTEKENNPFSLRPNEAFHLAAACLSGSDATRCNEPSGDSLHCTEALLQELCGLTGIDGQAVYLNQINLNPSLALQCSGGSLKTLICLKLSLK